MGTFFANMGGLLQKGYTTLTNVLLFPAKQVVNYYQSDFFGRQFQRNKVIPSIVSNTPRGDTSGYRQTSQEAQTITPWYKRWWTSSVNLYKGVESNFKTMIMGKSLIDERNKTLSVLGQETGKLARGGITKLADYFMQKWGMTNREPTGEYSGEANAAKVIYQNPTQQPNQATEPFAFGNIMDYFNSGSQPKGEFALSYPISEPIPVVVPTGTENVAKKGFSLSPLVLIGIAVGGFFLLRKKGGK